MSRRSLLSADQRARLFATPVVEAGLTRHYVLSSADFSLIRTKRRASNRLGLRSKFAPPRRVLPPTGRNPRPHLREQEFSGLRPEPTGCTGRPGGPGHREGQAQLCQLRGSPFVRGQREGNPDRPAHEPGHLRGDVQAVGPHLAGKGARPGQARRDRPSLPKSYPGAPRGGQGGLCFVLDATGRGLLELGGDRGSAVLRHTEAAAFHCPRWPAVAKRIASSAARTSASALLTHSVFSDSGTES